MARSQRSAIRSTRSSNRGEEEAESPAPTAATRVQRTVPKDEPDDSPQPRQRRRTSGQGAGSGGGSSNGDGDGGGSLDFMTQDGTNEEEGTIEFSSSQGIARGKTASIAAQLSKDVLIDAKDEKKALALSDMERADLIKSMTRFLVMKGLNHEPVTKKEMMDVVLGPTYRGKGVLKFVLSKANIRIAESLGFRVNAVSADSPYFVKDVFYVMNTLNNSDHSVDILRGQGQAGRGLLTIVLCVIYCSSDNVVAEDDLFKKLHNGLDKRIPERPWLTSGSGSSKTKCKAVVAGLGDIHELLATFVRQHYLAKQTVTKRTSDGGSESILGYKMGARGALEVGNLQIATLMAETMGQTVDPSALLELDPSQGFSQINSQD